MIAIEAIGINDNKGIEYNEGIIDVNGIQLARVDKDKIYEKYIFPTDIDWNGNNNYEKLENIDSDMELGKSGEIKNYVVNEKLKISGNIDLVGNVNVFLKKGLDIELENDKSINEEDKYKINFYIESGEIQIQFPPGNNSSSIIANIISNSENHINIQSNNNKDNKKIFKGLIYAPQSTINIGGGDHKDDFVYYGIMLGNKIILNKQNVNQPIGFLETLEKYGNHDNYIEIPTGREKTILKEGYYK